MWEGSLLRDTLGDGCVTSQDRAKSFAVCTRHAVQHRDPLPRKMASWARAAHVYAELEVLVAEVR